MASSCHSKVSLKKGAETMLYLVARKKILNVTEYLKNNSEKDRSGTRPHTNTDISLPVYLQSWWQAVSGLGNNAFPPRYMSMSI